jgi:PAS domain S-box-containing protein
LNNLLSSVNIPIVMLGNDLRVRRFTPQAEKVLNLLPTDVGRKVTDFRIKINIPDLESLFLDVIENLHTKEREVQDEDGRAYLMSIRPYRTGDNKIDGAVMTLFDITERKRADLRHRRMFEAAKDGIAIIEGPTGVVLDVNPGLTELSGFSRDEWIGRRIRETGFFLNNSFPDISHLADGESVQRTVVLHDRSGQPVDTEVIAAAHTEGTKLVVQLNFRDVGMRLRAEEGHKREDKELRESEKLDAVARLAGGMAHDWNNVLTAILGYSDLLKSHAGDNEALLKDLEEIRRSGERATALARQLMAFGRRQVVQPKVLDINTIVTDLDQMLRLMLNDQIRFKMHAKATGAVMADPAQIEQIVTMLVLNARDAMPEGGDLTVETADFGKAVLIAVTDSGVGIDDHAKSHLFEPFFSTKPRGMGAGLGLSTIYTMVKELGGSVRIESQLGEGTTVQVSLPSVEPATPAPELPDPKGTETILLLEDDPTVRRLAGTVLRERGYHVVEAANGPEALRLAKEQKDGIHLLLTSVIMPRMSGREVSDRISTLTPGIRTLFISGDAEDAIIHHGVLEPGFAFLPKPFTPKSLSLRVREVLDAASAKA